MRILLVSAVLAMTAACVMPPPQQQAAAPPPPPPVALAPMPPAAAPPPPVMAMPAPAPVPAPAVAEGPTPVTPGILHPTPVAYMGSLTLPVLRLMRPEQLRLTLSNYSFDTARVQVLTTPYPDCLAREGTALGEFVLPLNGTHTFDVPDGTDICWRRVDAPPPGQQQPVQPLAWNRAYLTSGHSIDARL